VKNKLLVSQQNLIAEEIQHSDNDEVGQNPLEPPNT